MKWLRQLLCEHYWRLKPIYADNDAQIFGNRQQIGSCWECKHCGKTKKA